MDKEPEWLKRLMAERIEMMERCRKLGAVLQQGRPEHISVKQWELMREQHEAMVEYKHALTARVDLGLRGE